MKNKTRTRLHKTLARLRGAHQLLGGVSLLDSVALFEVCRPVYNSLTDQIAALEKTLPPPRL